MNKNTIIALVLGLVIGGVAIWLLLSFGIFGTTMINTGVGTISPSTKLVTDQGTKTWGELLNYTNLKQQHGTKVVVIPTGGGNCGWVIINGTKHCGTKVGGTCDEPDSGCAEAPDDEGVLQCTCPLPD